MPGRNRIKSLPSPMYDRKWRRFKVRIPARIALVDSKLSTIFRRCEIVDISQGGARLEVLACSGLASHFYLETLDGQHHLGCIAIDRQLNAIGVQFISEISDATIIRLMKSA